MKRGAIKPPIGRHGGKYFLACSIVEQFPEHHTYVEPFGGAASVLLNKVSSAVEVYNDLDEKIARLFRVLRENGKELQRKLVLTPYSEVEFIDALEPSTDEIEQARRDFVRWKFSFAGRRNSFSYGMYQSRRGMCSLVASYLSSIDEHLPDIVERLREVQIVNRPAFDVIEKWDSPDTLFYCDPPYLPTVRAKGSCEIYDYEMSKEDHISLADILKRCKGKVVLSGYPSILYSKLYSSWRRIVFDVANHAANTKTKARKSECLWMNYGEVVEKGSSVKGKLTTKGFRLR